MHGPAAADVGSGAGNPNEELVLVGHLVSFATAGLRCSGRASIFCAAAVLFLDRPVLPSRLNAVRVLPRRTGRQRARGSLVSLSLAHLLRLE